MKGLEEIGHLSGLNVLLIDDDEDDCDFFAEALKQLSSTYRFAQGRKSELVYSYIEETKPHLIFLDINMPGKNGIAWLKDLKAHETYRHIPVIMYSVSMNQHDIDECKKAGAHHYLVKPYVESNLLATLKKIFSIDWKVAPALPRTENFLIDIDYKVA